MVDGVVLAHERHELESELLLRVELVKVDEESTDYKLDQGS